MPLPKHLEWHVAPLLHTTPRILSPLLWKKENPPLMLSQVSYFMCDKFSSRNLFLRWFSMGLYTFSFQYFISTIVAIIYDWACTLSLFLAYHNSTLALSFLYHRTDLVKGNAHAHYVKELPRTSYLCCNKFFAWLTAIQPTQVHYACAPYSLKFLFL